jgi:hypothetical protein
MVGAPPVDGQVTVFVPWPPQFQAEGFDVTELTTLPAGNVNVTTASGTLQGPSFVTTAVNCDEVNVVIVMNASAAGSD